MIDACQDTIVAVSSPPGRSWRGLVRMSGPGAFALLATLFGEAAPNTRTLRPRRMSLDGGGATLATLVTQLAAPATYTGQDMAEIQCPGHPALLERLVHRLMEAGARLAEPGEFTFRAYLAGKLDLTQAEGIGATIAAASDSQLEAARLLRQGRLGATAARLVDQLATLLALVEAGIDFVDQDDVVAIAPAALDDGLAAVEAKLDELLSRSRAWGALEALPRIVLVGRPSSGKSTLFNALLGRSRAVVSAVAGTTRDVLAEPMRLEQADGRAVEVMLVDIAGLDDPRTALDKDVQTAARDAIARADLVLQVFDRDDGRPAPPPNAPHLRVRTMVDIRPVESGEGAYDAAVSGATGEHVADLRALIAQRIGDRGVSLAGDMLALAPRHRGALAAAQRDIAEARAMLGPQRGREQLADVEIIAGLMRSALDHLAGLGGAMTADDVIGRVFATFCIGK